MDFTSGVTGDGFYIISMDDYCDNDIQTAFEMTKICQKLENSAHIKLDEFEQKYLTCEWKGRTFFPTLHDTKIDGAKLVRVFKIYQNSVNYAHPPPEERSSENAIETTQAHHLTGINR